MSKDWVEPKTESFDQRKFRELVLYIAKKSSGDVNFGDTKLNKLMFHSERLSFVRLGRSLTGQRFQKQKFGQTSRNLLPVRREMVAARECEVIPVPTRGDPQKRTVALRDARTSLFSREELAVVDHVIRENWEKTGSQMSREAKSDLCWKAARGVGDEVHLASLIFKHRQLTKEEANFARRARAELNGSKASP